MIFFSTILRNSKFFFSAILENSKFNERIIA